MGRDSKEHIGAAELGRLLEECRAHPESQVNAPDLHPHLATCMSCREQFEGLALLERQLMSGGQSQSTASRADCPDPEFWREVAAGLTPPDDVLRRIGHASRCVSCGPLLHKAVAELMALKGELTEEERKRVAGLESARAEWQHNLAHRITATSAKTCSPSWWRRQVTIPRLACAGACALAMVAVTSWVWIERNQPSTAERFLAQAYTEKRTLELRMAGAEYAPVRVSRGATASFTSRPEPLLKAEALIAGKLEAHPSDPAWLQAEANADILEGKYDVAVEALHRALELTPHSPELLIDLATAHFQRALEGERKDDFDKAYEYLSQALTFRPDDPVALFNRAIVAEQQFLFQQAVDDWDHYLRVDSSSQWADEARSRADAIRQKLKQHTSNAAPLLTPAELAARIGSANLVSEVDQRIEEYLHQAIRSWLPEAFPEAGGRESHPEAKTSAAQALFFLADLTRERHGDRWLADFLSYSSSAPHFPQAAAALAQSARANDDAEYDLARQQADVAERLFHASGNSAGMFRAQFERIFAAQITRQSEDCRRQAARALKAAESFSYPWVRIQLVLENGVCSRIMGDVGTYENATHNAMEQAQKSGYQALYLRALGFAAEIQFDSGNYSTGSKLAYAGLARYWSGQYPVMRGYNLYTEVADKAEHAGQSNFSMAAWREAVALVDLQESVLLSAWAHRALATAAVVANKPQIAERQYAEASRLFMRAPDSGASHTYLIENEISTARLEARLGHFDAAIARLTAAQERVRSLSNNYLLQMFYSTLGELELGRQRNSEAELALRPAMALAEQNLETLTSEEDRTQWSKKAAPVYLALSEAELLQGRSQDALETYEFYLSASQRVSSIRSRSPSQSNRLKVNLLTTGPASSNELLTNQSSLASRLPLLTKETVLTYAALPHGLAIWLYDDRGLKAQWMPQPTDDLRELSERFQNLSSDPKSELSAVRRDARSLYAALITPVENDLSTGRTLVIESDGWLARVPFEALLDAGDRYLIERAPIVHSLGETSPMMSLNDTRISAGSKAVVVGSSASSEAEGLIPLPDVLAEADIVAGGFHDAQVLKGREATLNAVRAELKNAQVFHFAGHSMDTTGGTGLLLEDESGRTNRPRLLDATVVRQLHPQNLQLAVLSACSTASGSDGSNGFNSITDALVRAGVIHVVASRWAVDSGASRRFVEDFYRNLLSGESVSEAVRSTSRKVLSNPQTSHPYYWSAFAAYGER